MAASANRIPLLQFVTKRSYAATICPRPQGKPADVESSVLANKVVVACAGSGLPVSRVAVVFRAGSRYESYENRGASHMLRIATGLSTQRSSGFAITRNIQQVGGNLWCTGGREIVAYSVEATSDKIETGLRFLEDVIAPAFKPWELSDSIELVRTQVAAIKPEAHAIEMMHKAAFRTGLGNSIYIPKHNIGKISSESLAHYFATNCTDSRCSIVGVGIDQNTLSGFAQSLELNSGESKPDSVDYYGGDVRKDGAGSMAHVAVGGLGGSLTNQKDTLAFAVLQQAMGSAPATKYGNANGSLGKALASAVGNVPVSSLTINANYSDIGLFGAVISTDASVMGKAVEAVIRVLKSGSVSDADVKRGKALVKMNVLESYATDRRLLFEMAMQAAITKQVLNVDTLMSAVDAITTKDVQDAAKKVASSKLSMGAIGNLAHVPYVADLA